MSNRRKPSPTVVQIGGKFDKREATLLKRGRKEVHDAKCIADLAAWRNDPRGPFAPRIRTKRIGQALQFRAHANPSIPDLFA